MVRIIGFLVGLGFAGVLLLSLIVNGIDFFQNPPAKTVEHEFHKHAESAGFSFAGPFGKYDRQQLQRGFQVYKEVCAACHGLRYVGFYSLHDLGYSEAELKAIANQWPIEVPSVNPDTGEAATRKALPSDHFPQPYANEVAARAANNNALPPDLSLMAKAREGGPDYIHALLTGYADARTYRNEKGEALPEENRPGEGLYFNPYFANLNLAMPPPLTAEGQVTYADGTRATVDQMAQDVSAFLMWAAEPKLEDRHRYGIAVLIFVIIATVLTYFAYRNVWATAKRRVALKGPLAPEHQGRREAAEAEQRS